MENPHLYHLTVKRPDSISGAAVCSFSPGGETLVVSRGSFIELFHLNDDSQLELTARTNCFATIRCLNAIRIPGLATDRLLVTSDSGSLAVLHFDSVKGTLSQHSAVEIAPHKLRHELPGEYVAVDPRGRVAMCAGLSNLRSVVLFQHRGAELSVIEAPMPSVFCYAVIALDYGYENPRFAFLEKFRFGKKMLTVYEFNLGLNRLMKEWSHEISDSCDLLVGLPATRAGPSGLLAFSGSMVYHFDKTGKVASEAELGEHPLSACIIKPSKDNFFALVCSKSRHLIKVSLNGTGIDSALVEVDSSLNSVASSMTVLKSGHLFIASHSGNHSLYQISSIEPLKLAEACELASLAPITTSAFTNRKLLIGGGASPETSRISHIQFGVSTDLLASTPLPGRPRAVFTLKRYPKYEFDGQIVISFESSTVVLAIGDDGAVEEVTEALTGIASNVDTLGISNMTRGIVQIHPKGLRYISSLDGVSQKVMPWLAPSKAKVVGCAFSPSQLAVALNNSTIVYFEERDGSLHESQHHLEVASPIRDISFSSLHVGELKSMQLFVALEDKTVRQYSVPQLKQRKLHNLSYLPTSIMHCIDDRLGSSTESIFVGQSNGTLAEIRDGETTLRVLGSSPTQLVAMSQGSVIAISSQKWLIENGTALPLQGSATQGLQACHRFSPEGGEESQLVGVNSSELVVFKLDADTERTNSHVFAEQPLGESRTPLQLIKNSFSDNLYIAPKSGCLTVVDTSLDSVEHLNDPCENPTAAVNVRFESRKREYLAIASGSKIIIFDYEKGTRNVTVVHETQVESECFALLPFRGKLLAGIRNKLILYDIGQKQLLLQDGLVLSDLISIRALRASQSLVFVGDVRRSVTAVMCDADGFRLVGVDPIPHAVSKMVVLDAGTLCIGDQYGNLTLLHYPEAANPFSLKHSGSHRSQIKQIAHYWVPDAIVGLYRGTLSSSSATEVIIYVGIQGTIGVLVPFISKAERDSFVELESYMMRVAPMSLLGRHVGQSPAYYFPKKNVVNGDLCEYLVSDYGVDLLQEAANELERTPADIARKIETIKTRATTRGSLFISSSQHAQGANS